MGTLALPPGFRFHPTDDELISHYLKGKLNNGLKEAELEVIPEVDLYKCEPWDLPEKSSLPNTDMEWYFFSPRDRKYPNGSRTNRATEAGYWKATGRDRKIYSRASAIGIKKTLVFYRGRAPQGERTDWVMHEYRLEENDCEAGPCLQNAFVLCHVFKKSELGAKNGEQYTAPVEKDDLSLTKKDPSPYHFGDIEVHSEDRSKPVESVDAISSLTPKFSLKILNDTTGDNATLNTWLDIFLDDSNSNSSCVAPNKDTINTQFDAVLDNPRMQCESACLDESEFPQIPVDLSFFRYEVQNGYLDTFFEEERMLEEMSFAASQIYNNSKAYHSSLGDVFADILNGGCIKLKSLMPSIEEMEHHDSGLWEVPNSSLDRGGTGIQISSHSSMLQGHQRGFLFDGTAARVCLQLHKMEDSEERYEKDLSVRKLQNTSNDMYDGNNGSTCGPETQQLHFDRSDGQKCDSHVRKINEKNNRENEDSAPEDLSTDMACEIDGTSSNQFYCKFDSNQFYSMFDTSCDVI